VGHEQAEALRCHSLRDAAVVASGESVVDDVLDADGRTEAQTRGEQREAVRDRPVQAERESRRCEREEVDDDGREDGAGGGAHATSRRRLCRRRAGRARSPRRFGGRRRGCSRRLSSRGRRSPRRRCGRGRPRRRSTSPAEPSRT